QVIGVDEVGRGPLAGPVVSAAVYFPKGVPDLGLKDSKALTAKARERISAELIRTARFSVKGVSAVLIDRIGIEKATGLAMRRAVATLDAPRDAVLLVDGNRAPDFGRETILEVKADVSCPSVSAAAILAKVLRDKAMVRLAARYGDYHWHTNKGYGSKAHRDAILTRGITAHHRRSFLNKILAAA
ncbi:MAG: ribonuclease HII, partial [Parvularcula sp.]|nr:ribonuclease HII [Parvularcula sp.]